MNVGIKEILDYPTDTPLKFWLKYWGHRIKELCDLDNYGIQLEGPHFLLLEILSEIEYNDFRNKDNRSLFKDLLGAILKQDDVFKELYRVEVGVAMQNWDKSPLVVKTILEKILLSMTEYNYLNLLANKLQGILEINQRLSNNIKDQICLYTDLFIQEIVCLGVDIEDVADLINEEGVLISDLGDVILCEDSFYELQRKEYVSEEDYHRAVSVRYKKRSAKEYIDNILKHFYKETKDGCVIFRLLGIKGSISYHVQNVHLYSIDKATYLSKDSLSKFEKEDASQYINVAVKVKHRFYHTSINYAKQRVESLLDYLSFHVGSNDKLSINEQFAVIVVDDQEVGFRKSFANDVSRMRQYMDLMAFDLTPYSVDIKDWFREFSGNRDISNVTFKKISQSTYWYRKAECATKYEDKLLYSWIALESILNVSEFVRANINPHNSSVINVAKILCPSVLVRNRFYSYARNVYEHLIRSTQDDDNYYDFTLETIKKAKLDVSYGEEIKLDFFFKELPKLIVEMNDEVFKIELITLQSFYKDVECVKKFNLLVSNDVMRIYRLRNMIVHNAECPNFIIKLYAYKAQFICGSLIRAVRYYYNKFGLNIDEILLSIHADYKIFENDIERRIMELKDM